MADTEKEPKLDSTGNPNVILREHVYDGIQEYDQKLPNWWLWSLYITIIAFVIFWLLYYHTPLFKDDRLRIDAQIAAIDAKRQGQLDNLIAKLDDESLWEMSREPATVSAGEEIFLGKCIACHGPDLSGKMGGVNLPGLPLNDTEWKHGGNPMDVFDIITNGAPDPKTGMIAWTTQMSPADIAKVTAFIMSHHEEGAEWTEAPPDAGSSPPPQ